MVTAESSTSASLLERVRQFEPEAWQRLSKLYSPLVYRWCRQAGVQDSDAADVVQEVFRAVASAISRFRYDQPDDTFRGWLRTITSNKIRDHFRRQQGKKDAEGGTGAQLRLAEVPDPLLDEDEPSEQNIIRQSVHQALEWIRGDFEQRTWEAFWKSQVEEQSTQDIAKQLEMTPAAVRKAKYRVLRRLREDIEGLLD